MNAAAVLAAARAELGTVESPPNSNRTRYGEAYGWNGVAWCAIWVWWVFGRAGAASLIPKTASTVAMRDWYRARGQWHTSRPQPGDLVFFRFAGNNNPVNHVGIVEAVEPGGTLVCLEGNTAGTNTGDQRNGGGVYRKRRAASIVGFARPAYAQAPAQLPGGDWFDMATREDLAAVLNTVIDQRLGRVIWETTGALPNRRGPNGEELPGGGADTLFGFAMSADGAAFRIEQEVRGLRAAVDRLAAMAGKGGGATADEIRNAVADAIQQGLVEVDITVRGQTGEA